MEDSSKKKTLIKQDLFCGLNKKKRSSNTKGNLSARDNFLADKVLERYINVSTALVLKSLSHWILCRSTLM